MLNSFPIENRQATKQELVYGRAVGASIVSSPTAAQNQAGVPEGFTQLIATKNGTGDYTLTFRSPALRTLVLLGITPLTADAIPHIVSATSSAIRVVFRVSGVATDVSFHFAIMKIMRKAIF